ncbi:MAG: phosphoglucosamine mutase [Candidatus Margulisiibacteriota bacterium]
MSKLIESISGIRGVVGDTLTPQVALETGIAFGRYLAGGTLIVGGDTRTSHDVYKSAVIAGLTAVGCKVIDIGKVPTPTVQQMIRHYSAQGGVIITASHNPAIWNGIKLMNHSGSFLTPTEYEAFQAIAKQPSTFQPWTAVGSVSVDTTALEKHIDHILSIIDPKPIQEAGLSAIVDPNNGTGCLANPILFEKLKVKATIINAEGNGLFAHDPEPLQKNLGQILDQAQSGRYDIGFIQDADADRLVILDEKGRFIGEDYSLGFCVDYLLNTLTTEPKKVVVNLSTSLVIEAIAKRHGASVHYTKIGETNVTQGIRDLQAPVGGEGNGGVIFPKVGWGRDSLTGMVVALSYLATSQKTVSDIVGTYPAYTLLREKVAVETMDQVKTLIAKVEANLAAEPATIDRQDGLKFSFDKAWVQIRASNTEPIVRIFAEAPTPDQATSLLKKTGLF